MNTNTVLHEDWLHSHISPYIEQAILTFLVPLGGHRHFLQANGVSHELLGKALDLTRFHREPDVGSDDSKENFDRVAALAYLRERYVHLVQIPTEWHTHDSGLTRNIRAVQTLLELSEFECVVLHFMIAVQYERLLNDASDTLNYITEAQAMQALAYQLRVDVAQVRAVLRKRAPLVRAGLVQLDKSASLYFSARFDLLTYQFADQMMDADLNVLDLLRDTVIPSESGHLHLDDYDHIAHALTLVTHTVQEAIAQRRIGVNILLYGAPGTGKTQLAKALAGAANVPLFDISNQDDDGDPITGDRRLRALNAAQQFFAAQKVLFVFDEVEDVFNDNDDGKGKSTAAQRKAWMNRTLETNPVPTIWISNNVYCMDDAFIRRYDAVLEVPIPNKQQRLRIIERNSHALLNVEQMRLMAQADYLAPAIVARAAQVVTRIHADLPTEQQSNAMHTLINHTLKAQGHSVLPKKINDIGDYHPEYCNTQISLQSILDGIRSQTIAQREARLCLYGYPGTGKTAFAQHLADELNMPLHVKRCSDLLSKWVGETERNIAQAFENAEQEQAILLIDEVDSVLADRRHAEHSWETTQVNEMLTQMEQFAGIFIATTNLMRNIDAAALRRFDLKVGFDYMRADQVGAMFSQTCVMLFDELPSADVLRNAHSLRQLTPGDFASVRRRHRFTPLIDEHALLAALKVEMQLKTPTSTPVGFLSSMQKPVSNSVS